MTRRDRRDRDAVIALAIIIGGAVLCAFFGFLETAHYRAGNNTAETSNNSGDQETYNGWRDSYAQWSMAALALGGIGVSAWGITLLRDTLRATRKGNRISRRIGEAQVRAYIEVERVSVDLVQRDKLFPLHSPTITISVVNNGSSPALNFTWVPTISFGFPMSLCRLITGPPSELAHNRSIPASRAPIALPTAVFTDSLSPDEDRAMRGGSMKAFVVIAYEFTDVFGRAIAEKVYFSGVVGPNDDLTVFSSTLERSVAYDEAAAAYTDLLRRRALAREALRDQMRAASDELARRLDDDQGSK